VEEIRAVCAAVSKPVNVLAVPGLSFAQIVHAGRRVSVGGGLTWVGVKAMTDAATAIRDGGDFSALEANLPLAERLADRPRDTTDRE
jgi:2-methylisocitrate lyase-like PEP mutase family enzyme